MLKGSQEQSLFLQTLIYGISRDGSKNFNIRTYELMIFGQLKMGARQTKNAPLLLKNFLLGPFPPPSRGDKGGDQAQGDKVRRRRRNSCGRADGPMKGSKGGPCGLKKKRRAPPTPTPGIEE